MKKEDWKKVQHFNEEEFRDAEKMDKEFVYWLDDLREAFGKRIYINSSYRDPAYNESVGGAPNSAHTEIPCKAADIRVENTRDRFLLVSLAIGMGCERIGIGETYLHIDFSDEKPKRVMWTYY